MAGLATPLLNCSAPANFAALMRNCRNEWICFPVPCGVRAGLLAFAAPISNGRNSGLPGRPILPPPTLRILLQDVTTDLRAGAQVHCLISALFAVDWPLVLQKPGTDWLKAAPVSEEERAKIAHGNAEKLLRL